MGFDAEEVEGSFPRADKERELHKVEPRHWLYSILVLIFGIRVFETPNYLPVMHDEKMGWSCIHSHLAWGILTYSLHSLVFEQNRFVLFIHIDQLQ